MNRQKYNEKYKPHFPKLIKSIAEGTSAAVDNDTGGVFKHSRETVHTLQQMTETLKKDHRIERQRDLLLVKLDEAKSKLYQGKKSMGFLVRGSIEATVPELVSLEDEVKGAQSMYELERLRIRILKALGYIK